MPISLFPFSQKQLLSFLLTEMYKILCVLFIAITINTLILYLLFYFTALGTIHSLIGEDEDLILPPSSTTTHVHVFILN